MRTSPTLFVQQAVSVTLCFCLMTSSVLAQKPKASAKPAAPPPAAAPPAPPPGPKPLSEVLTGQALSDYESAKLLYQDGDFAGAGLKFKQAFDASKEVRLLWNVAACEKNQRHYSKVFKLVQLYLDLGKTVLSRDDEKDAADLLDAMKSYVSKVKITVNEPEAVISIDDDVVGVAPLTEPLLVDMGPRRLRVTKPGFTPFTETLQVAGANELPLVVKLEKETHEGRLAVAAASDSLVYLDGKMVAQGHWDGPVPSGRHMLRVTQPGMKTYTAEIVLADKETRTLQVTLDPEAKKESNNTIWWILGGAVAAGAAATGVALLVPWKQETRTTPDPVLGTIQPGSVQLGFQPWWSR